MIVRLARPVNWVVVPFVALIALTGCTTQQAGSTSPAKASATTTLAPQSDPAARRAYFGDLHIHTGYSLDAWALMGVRTTPDEAYRFGRGEPVTYLGQEVQRAWPLDFLAVTDHANNLCALNDLEDPESPLSKSPLGQKFMKNLSEAYGFLKLGRNKDVPNLDILDKLKGCWEREIDAANNNYRPGTFTTFIGYEFSAMPNGYNLHRNVIFSGDRAPIPLTSNDTERPEDLWTYLEAVRRQGIDVLAIPHNSNASNGLMFDWNDSDGRPIDRAYAERRALNEPLVEIAQSKGQSETLPGLSSSDEAASFEIFDKLLTRADLENKPEGGYVRDAYGRGLAIQQRVSANPYKMGVVGGSDFHNSLSTSDESAYQGGPFGADPRVLPTVATAQRRLGLIAPEQQYAEGAGGPDKKQAFRSPVMTGSGALTGVWAEHNTREAIFAAFQRKETFATSGPRIRVRFFGAWKLDPALLKRRDWVVQAYKLAIPMGGDLPSQRTAEAPHFILHAVKGPNDANLDRIQIIKVWLEGDDRREKIFDVAWAGQGRRDSATGKLKTIGNSVDLKTATYKNNIGATEFLTTWADPDFDAKQAAVYYVRVLQIPTPRWTTYLAVARGLPLPSGYPATIQERAWSSPIWYTPAAKVVASR